MSIIPNVFGGLLQPSFDASPLSGNGAKLALAGAALGLAAFFAFESRPAPLPVNAPIIRIVSQNDVDGVRDAIARDPAQLQGLDLDGNTPLHIAARGGFAEMVEALVAAGADVNVANKAGWTPLASALLSHEKNQAAIVNALIAAGANTKALVAGGKTLGQLAQSLPGVDRKVLRLIAPDAGATPAGVAYAGRPEQAYASTLDRRN